MVPVLPDSGNSCHLPIGSKTRYSTSPNCILLIGLLLGPLLNGALLARSERLGPVYFSLAGSVGYSQASVAAGTTPTLAQWGASATVGAVLLQRFLLGASSNFHYVGHHSELDSITGNFQGNRFNIISPAIGFIWGKLVTQAEFQFLGEYRFLTPTAGGAELTYKSPLGGRLTLSYPIAGQVYLGLLFEWSQYRTESSTITGETELTEKLTLWQAGTTLSFFL